MASEQQSGLLPPGTRQIKRVPLGRTRRRLSFELRLRLWLWLMGLPAFALCWILLRAQQVDATILAILLAVAAAGWAFAVSLVIEHITRPLQTLANVVAALREDDYSF